MYSKSRTNSSTADSFERLRGALEASDAVLIGAGAGLSTAAGLTYSGERFQRYFSDFAQKYGIQDIYSGGFYPFGTLEEYWAWWSCHIFVNRYDVPAGKPYLDLLRLVQGKDYFVLTTNVDHQFQLAGFDKKRLFYMQGDYGLWQCSKACHAKTYDNEQAVRQMIGAQRDMRIPSELVPRCPVCGAPMTMNLRCDDTFVQDAGWYTAQQRYLDYICVDQCGKLLRPNYVTEHFAWLIEKYGLKKIRFHDLRHTCASLLLSSGISMKQIQILLGHSTFATTADIYAHLDFTAQEESANAMSGMFSREPKEVQPA